MDLEHGLTAEVDYRNPNFIAINKGGGSTLSIIAKQSDDLTELIFLGPVADEIQQYIKNNQRQIETHFRFNEVIGDEVGVEKFETCVHRSVEKEETAIPTCCSIIMVTDFKCYKRGFPKVVPTICKGCGDYQKRP